MSLRYNFSPAATGNANTLVVGSAINGNSIDVNDGLRQKVFGLSALVTVLADTSTFTWSGRWEVSNDGTTWVQLTNGPQNAAAVVLATGTAGADTAVTRAIPAPDSIYGWRKARYVLVTGGTTGAAIDTYTNLGYCFRNVF